VSKKVVQQKHFKSCCLYQQFSENMMEYSWNNKLYRLPIFENLCIPQYFRSNKKVKWV